MAKGIHQNMQEPYTSRRIKSILMSGVLPVLMLGFFTMFGQESVSNVKANAQEELVALRTSSSKTYALPDGKKMTRVYEGQVHYRDAANTWKDVNTEIVASKQEGYSLENKTNGVQSYFPEKLGEKGVKVANEKGYYTLGSTFTFYVENDINTWGNNGLEVDLKKTSPQKTTSNKVIYDNAHKLGYVEYEVGVNQVKQQFILEQLPANTSGKYLSMGETIELPEGWKIVVDGKEVETTATTKGQLEIYNEQGNRAFQIPLPEIYEQNDNSEILYPDGNMEQSFLVKKVEGTTNQYALKVSIPMAWLTAADRNFPIVIDPSSNLSGGWGGWLDNSTGIVESNPTQYVFAGVTSGTDHVGWNKFDISSIPDNSTISSVTLELYCNGSSSASTTINIDINDITGTYGPYSTANPTAYADFNNGTYASLNVTGIGYYSNIDLGSQAAAHLESRLSGDEFQIALDANGSSIWKRFTSNINNITVVYEASTDKIVELCYGSVPSAFPSVDSASGGSGNYAYQWQQSADYGSNWLPAAGKNDSMAYVPSVQLTDTTFYRRMVIDQSCGDSAYSNTIEVHVPDSLQLDTSFTYVSCNGLSDGAIDLTVIGGASPYTYLWSNTATTEDLSGLAAGTYTVTVTDDFGCDVVGSYTITEPAVLAATGVVDSNVTCNGFSDGGATAVATGGTQPYTYLWSNAATTASITGVVSGTYTVTVTDNNSCTSTSSVTITEPATLVASSVVDSNVTCNGLSDGGATATAVGGTQPFSYVWSNSATTASITGVVAGTYTVTVTDNNSCTSTSSVTITEPATLVASSVVDSNVTCNGLSDGGASASATGGTQPYSYVWSNAATTASITGVAAGTYTVTVTDNNSCTSTSSVTITEPATLVASSVVDSNVTCNGLSDGGATASATGGTQPYNYLWSNAATTASITGVAAGTYTVTITDGNGCNDTSMVTVTEPAVLVASSVVDSNVSCNGLSDGGATAWATGGTQPFSYVWSNAATTASITGVVAGTYTVTVTDNNSCTSTSSATITEPVTLVASSVVDSNVTCNGFSDGGATASATGGTQPFSYVWSNAATTASITGVAAGTYTVTVTDNNSCTSTSSVTITEPDTLVASSVVDSNVTCNGLSDGGASASATGGTQPFSYVWSNAATTASITGVAAGTYTVTVTDNNSCTSTSSVTITEPATLVASSVVDSNVTCNGLSDGGASASATGGTQPYSYVWSNAATTASITGVAAGTYTVTITDGNGCTSTSSAEVTEPATLIASSSVLKQESCVSFSDGSLSVTATGGTQPYSYLWSSGATSATVNNVTAGTYTVTVTDGNSCTSTSSSTIIVQDVTPPAIVTQNITIYLDVTGSASIAASDIDNGTSDACGIDTMYLDVYQFSCSDIGANTVTLTATDVNTLTDTKTATVTVLDTIRPAMATQNITVYLNGAGTASITTSDIDNGTADACGIASLSLDTSAFDCDDLGTNTVYLKAIDHNNNVDSAAAVVTVIDSITPIARTQNLTVYLDGAGQAVITPAMVNNGSSDNCVADLSLSQSIFTCADLGLNLETLTVTDNNANSSSATFLIDVKDTISPTLISKNITVQLGATGQVSIAPSQLDSISTDNCANQLFYHASKTTFNCGDLGANTVNLTITDGRGNSTTGTTVVTVEDNIYPVGRGRDITVYLDASGNVSITPSMINNGSTDNCSVSTVSLDKLNFSCSNAGANTITLSVTDQSGNTSTTNNVVTVVDTISPVVATQNITVYLDASGSASITTGDIDNGSADACGINSLSLDVTSFSCSNVGANTVTLTATDNNSNVATATAVVTVVDTISPAVATQNITVYLDASGSASITTGDIDNGSADACGINTLSLDVTSFSCAEVGTHTVTLTATDNNSNVATATAVVTVVDTISPAVAAQNITVYLDASGSASITTSDIDNGSTDACGINTLSLDVTSFGCTEVGTNTVTLTATDNNSNVSTATAVVTVVDTISPAVAAQNITVYLDASGSASITTGDIDNGSADACGINTLSLDVTSFSCTEVGTNTVTLTATDNNSNVATATAVVTVVDTISPAVAAQNITVYLDASGSASITTSDIDNGSADACGINSLSLDVTSFSCTEVGSNTVTLTATDNNSNVATATAVVTVVDTISPAVAAQNITVYLDASGSASITTSDIDNGSADACGINSLSLDVTSFSCTEVGTNTVTLTATDNNSNVATATAVVTVVDTISPAVATQNITVYLDASGSASITASDIDNGSSDNCMVSALNVNQSMFNCSHLGANTITLTAVDPSNNSSSATATVTVIDTISPAVVTQNITISLDANGAASITTGDVDNGTADACGVNNLSLDVTSFSCADIGPNTVTLTATDGSSNTSSATAIVTVEDNMAPVVAVQNITVYLDASGNRTVLPSEVDNGTTDNCGTVNTALDVTVFDCADLGQNLVNFTATDAHGNSSQATAFITVVDTIDPAITNLPSNITAYAGSGQCAATVQWPAIMASDNCSNTFVNTSQVNGGLFSIGTTTVSVNVMDGSGNSTSQSFDVTVIDTISPVLSGVPSNVSITPNANSCDAVVSWSAPTAFDNCGTVTLVSNFAPGATLPLGTTTITYTATDNNGNTSSLSFDVTVTDQVDPIINGTPANITQAADAGSCSAVVNFTMPTATDNCTGATISASHTSGASFPVGTTTVSFTATDAAGNTATSSFTITVEDQEKPVVVSVPANDTVGTCSAAYVYSLPVATDNCSGVTITQTAGLPSGNIFPAGITQNVFRISDAAGNDTVVSFTIVVVPQGQPQLTSVVEVCVNDPSIEITLGQDIVWSGNGIINNGTTFDPATAGVGRHNLAYSYTDASGCITAGNIYITVLPAPQTPVIIQSGSTQLATTMSYDTYQWFRDGVAIAGANMPTYDYMQGGNYQVMVGNSYGCSVYGEGYVVGTSGGGIGLEEFTLADISIYPNPTQGAITIDLKSETEDDLTVVLYGISGKKVYEKTHRTLSSGTLTLDFSHLPDAAYLLQVRNAKDMVIKKIIIQ